MKVVILLAALISWVFCQKCEKGEVLTLSKLVKMKCKKGVWKPQEKRAGPGAPPCVDNPVLVENGSCLANANEGHCNQFTVKGQDMDRDCPGTCESCDECRCMDSVQWHSYCGYWSQYCNNAGVLGTWMSTNCRKTCKKCRCKCCSYQGKQHKLGARILLPNVCGALVCEESLQAQPSPLLSGAVQHAVSHPEELTLNFKNMLPGRECCLLPGGGRSANSSMIPSGGMVQEGWKGSLTSRGNINITCSHGSLYTPLEEKSCIQTNASSTAKLEIFNCENSDPVKKYLDASTGSWPQDKFCMAIGKQFEVGNASYGISVDLNNDASSGGPGFGHLGLAYNLLDENTYEGVYLRVHTSSACIQPFHVQAGNLQLSGSRECEERPKAKTWFNLKIYILSQMAEIYIDDKYNGQQPSKLPIMPRGAIVVPNGYKNVIFYKNFQMLYTYK